MVELGAWSKMAPDDKLQLKSDSSNKTMKASSKEIIHSGHFMVSEIDDSEVQEEEQPSLAALVDAENDESERDAHLPEKGVQLQEGLMNRDLTYLNHPHHHSYLENAASTSQLPISIDSSLTKLFECMSLAYSGRLTSPRWQNFKGLKFRLKEKIRLNNIIWRAWHLQFIARRDPIVCQFAIDADVHNKPEAIVMEGKYWKRKLKNIKAEYKKWRMFYKEHFQRQQCRDSPVMDWDTRWPWPQSNSSCGDVEEDLMMDFSDTWFNSLIPSQPFDFPNPREIAKAGIADFIQPGLVQLQPSFEECMDTLDPFQAFLTQKLPPLPEETNETSGMGYDSSTSTFKEACAPPRPPESDVIQVDGSLKTQTPPPPDAGQLDYSGRMDYQTQGYTDLFNSLMKSVDKTNMTSSADVPQLQQDCGALSNVSASAAALVSMCAGSSLIPDTVPLATPSTATDQASLKPVVQQQPEQNLSLDQSQTEATYFGFQEASHTPPARSTRTRRTNLLTRKVRLQPMQQGNLLQAASPPLAANQVPPNSSQPLNTFNAQLPAETFGGSYLPIAPRKHSVPSPATHETPVNADLSSFPPPVHLASTMCSTDPVTTQSHIQVVGMQNSSVMSLKMDAALQDLCSVTGATPKRTSAGEDRSYRRNSHAGYYFAGSHQRGSSPSGKCFASPELSNASLGLTNTDGTFAMPKAPLKQRVRSRSVSSPQIGSPKIQPQQPSQAVSLTNISISPPPMLTVPSVTTNVATSQTTATAAVLACTSPVLTAAPSTSNATVLQQNAVLAQLLSSGGSFVGGSGTSNISPVTCATTITATSAPTVTIISSVPAVASTVPQTFVLSPVTLATVAGMSDFQRPLIVGTTNQVFGANGAAKVPLPLSSQVASTGPVTGGSPTPVGSHLNDSAGSANKPFKPKSDEERVQYKEHRRVSHINAEQKRRCNIKNGFDALKYLLPSLSQNPNAKVSKAAMLQKGADYIRTLKAERQQQQEEVEQLKKQIEDLNQVISMYQSQLPATGAPVMCQRTNRMKELFEEYVRTRTLQNWKFWIFSLIIEPLLESYSNSAMTSNVDEFCKAVVNWLEQHCSLVALRPGVLNSLRHLSTTTNILTDPSRLPEEATWAVTKKENARQ